MVVKIESILQLHYVRKLIIEGMWCLIENGLMFKYIGWIVGLGSGTKMLVACMCKDSGLPKIICIA